MRWLAALGGLAALLVGAALVVEPFASLEVLVVVVAGGFLVLAVSEALNLRHDRWVPSVLALVVWLIAAGAVLVLPSVTVGALSVVVGISLVLNGLLRIGGAWRAPAVEQLEAIGFGAAGVILGVLALVWPGVTLLVIAEVVALWIAITGWSLLLRAFRGEHKVRGRHSATPRWARTRRLILPALALATSLALAAASLFIQTSTRHPSGFYATPEVITEPAGSLVRAQPFEKTLPEGSRGWRILYVTSREDNVAAVASALVVVPESANAQTPVIAWAHGTAGISRGCAPSLHDSFTAYGALPAEAIRNGWAVVAPDYIGLGTEGPSPYLIGQGEGRAVLDAVRAARQIPRLELSTSTVLWGHSQGGHAGLWSGILQPTYAPDVELLGIGALAPATDLPEIIGHLQPERAGVTLGAYLIASYAENYPDVELANYVRPVLEVPVRGIALRCTEDPGILVSAAVSAMLNRQVWIRDPQTGPFGQRLTENVPGGSIGTPVLLAQGADDTIIPAELQRTYVDRQCGAGNSIDYRVYPEGHDSLVGTGSPLIPELVSWTKDRLNRVAVEGCTLSR